MGGPFGAYGKMPSAGDFFRLNTPQGFVDPWDQWLQAGLLNCQSALGADWDACFLSAPIWRFGLSAGLVGPRPLMGVLMPSVDRVGRRFPLTLMAPLEEGTPVIASHFREDALFRRLESLALSTLEDDLTRDRLQSDLEQLPAPAMRAPGVLRRTGRTLVLSQGNGLSGAAGDLAAGLLGRHYATPSIWSAEIAEVPRLLLCDGLPEEGDMLALMNLHAPTWTEARPI